MSLFWSACLGSGIGLMYAAMAYLTQRLAVQRAGSGFMGLIVGGMLVRMLVLLVLVGATLALMTLHVLAFVIALVVTLLVGLGLDAWWMFRYLELQSKKGTRPPNKST